MDKYRVGLITKDGKVKSINAKDLEGCYEFLLEHEYKSYRIVERDTKLLVETDKGKIS